MIIASPLALSILYNCWTVIIYRRSSFLFPLELAARDRNVLVLGDDFPLSLSTALAVVVAIGNKRDEDFLLELVPGLVLKDDFSLELGECSHRQVSPRTEGDAIALPSHHL